MKSFKEVEATRQKYIADAASESVHRSSLMVSEMPGADVDISFVNHFLLKRGYDNIACRVTSVDSEGNRLDTRLYPISEPRVYTVPLSQLKADGAASYHVEFFSAENLFIPFPAVMVNHRGKSFFNMVHAYNRILNDVFEEDSINVNNVSEASIDLLTDREGTDTFAVFAAGQMPCRGDIEIEARTARKIYKRTVPLDVPRFGSKYLSVRSLLADLPDKAIGELRLRQPKQFLFYGRLFAGRSWDDGAFSANHSYYDSSETEEYWDDTRPTTRCYPFFPDCDTIVRIHPIMSPSNLAVFANIRSENGRVLGEVALGEISSPGHQSVDASINAALLHRGINLSDVASFIVRAEAISGRMPTRVNHQLVHADGGLESSINVSLHNPNVVVSLNKMGFAGGQIPVGGPLSSCLGIVGGMLGRGDCDVHAVFYDESGEIGRRSWKLSDGGAVFWDPLVEESFVKAIKDEQGHRYIWYVLTGERPDLTAFVVTRHLNSGHCTGEHSF